MKKLIVFALLLFASVAAWADQPSVPENVRYTLTIKQAGKLVSQADVVAVPGTSTPIQLSQEHTYIKQACKQEAAIGQRVTIGHDELASDLTPADGCAGEANTRTTQDGSSEITLVPGTFNTGLSMALDTYAQSDVVHVRIALTQLVKMNTLSQDGMTIEMPETTQQVIDQHLKIKPNQTVTVVNNEQNGMQVTLTRL